MQAELKDTLDLSTSRKTLRKFLKEDRRMSYKKVSYLQPRTNHLNSKLKRQFAASIYIRSLYEGVNIIKFDECSIRFSEHRKYSWG